MATFLSSILTVVVQSERLSLDWPMFGSGVGTNGAGGPGILQTFGTDAVAMSVLPSVTGVLGGFTPTEITTGPPASSGGAGRPPAGRFRSRPRAARAGRSPARRSPALGGPTRSPA